MQKSNLRKKKIIEIKFRFNFSAISILHFLFHSFVLVLSCCSQFLKSVRIPKLLRSQFYSTVFIFLGMPRLPTAVAVTVAASAAAPSHSVYYKEFFVKKFSIKCSLEFRCGIPFACLQVQKWWYRLSFQWPNTHLFKVEIIRLHVYGNVINNERERERKKTLENANGDKKSQSNKLLNKFLMHHTQKIFACNPAGF